MRKGDDDSISARRHGDEDDGWSWNGYSIAGTGAMRSMNGNPHRGGAEPMACPFAALLPLPHSLVATLARSEFANSQRIRSGRRESGNGSMAARVRRKSGQGAGSSRIRRQGVGVFKWLGMEAHSYAAPRRKRSTKSTPLGGALSSRGRSCEHGPRLGLSLLLAGHPRPSRQGDGNSRAMVSPTRARSWFRRLSSAQARHTSEVHCMPEWPG